MASKLRPALLIVEGTHLGHDVPTDELEVRSAAENVVKSESDLIIADFAPRNIERLRTFHEITQVTGRRLVITTRDAYLLQHMHLVDPKIPHPGNPELAVLQEAITSRGIWERNVLAEFGQNAVRAQDVSSQPGGFILCLSYWDIANLIDLEPNGGTYIYSSSEAYSEEQAIDQERLLSWLHKFRIKAVGGLPGAEEGPFHASGHIDGQGMTQLIETISPDRILPVHSQQVQWFQSRWPDKTLIGSYGEPVHL